MRFKLGCFVILSIFDRITAYSCNLMNGYGHSNIEGLYGADIIVADDFHPYMVEMNEIAKGQYKIFLYFITNKLL